MAILTFSTYYVPDAVYTSSLLFHNYLESIVIISILQIKKQFQEIKQLALKLHSDKFITVTLLRHLFNSFVECVAAAFVRLGATRIKQEPALLQQAWKQGPCGIYASADCGWIWAVTSLCLKVSQGPCTESAE